MASNSLRCIFIPSRHDVRARATRQQLPVGPQELHARARHARAQAHDFGAQFKELADAGAQVVDAQVDGAELGEAVQALLGRFVHVTRADGGHAGQAAHGVEPGADHAAVDAVIAVVAHELVPHVDARGDAFGFEAGDLQAKHLVEDDFFFKDGSQAGHEFGLEFGGCRGWGAHRAIVADAARGHTLRPRGERARVSRTGQPERPPQRRKRSSPGHRRAGFAGRPVPPP